MRKFIKIFFYFLTINLIFFGHPTKAQNAVKIIFDVNNDIVTNIDIKNEFKYLLAVDRNFSKLDENKGLEIAKNNAIKDMIRKNRLKKTFNLGDNYDLVDKIILDYFKSIGLTNKKQIIEFLKNFDLEYKFVQKKFEIETLWKELIVLKYLSKVNIDEDKIKKKLEREKLKKKKSFLLSEILFELKDTENLEKKFNLIKDDISKNGFEASATLFSISETSKTSGKIGWVNENQLSKKFLDNILNLNINDITNPIRVSSGFLILKLEDTKEIIQTNDINKELKKIMQYEKNRQLNDFSNIFYEKLKINSYINER